MDINHIGSEPTDAEIDALFDEMKVHLEGKGMMLQGAVLADLVATYFAGHHPEIRQGCIDSWMAMMRELVPVNEKRILEAFGSNPWKESIN